jgi:hypothetical protein
MVQALPDGTLNAAGSSEGESAVKDLTGDDPAAPLNGLSLLDRVD